MEATKKSSCKLLLQSLPKVFEYADLRSTYIVIVSYYVEHCANPSDEKTFIVVKDSWVLFFLLSAFTYWDSLCTPHFWLNGYNKTTLAAIPIWLLQSL